MKTNPVSRFFLSVIIVTSLITTQSCSKKTDPPDPQIIKPKVTGHVQKGPFINGTSISMSELSDSLSQTGKVFTTQISNNSGSFEIKDIALTSSYVEFSASGYYFDEVKGALSVAPLNLFALSDITDISTVNVNILTHLEKVRVGKLVNKTTKLADAKKIAQGEILAIFGFNLTGMDNSEELDISVDNDGNAILIAISIILQGDRSVGDLTELMAGITNDIGGDGILNSETIKNELRNSARNLDLAAVRLNLEHRYQELGVSAKIPDFEKYVNKFLVYTAQSPATSTLVPTDVTIGGAKLNGTVNPNSLSTTVTFEYGTGITYGNIAVASQSPVIGSTSVNAEVVISGLLPGTTYHFRIKSQNSLGTATGSDMTFTTLGQLPVANVLPADNIQLTSASVYGTVNPNNLSTTVGFEWGITTAYGHLNTANQSPVTGNIITNVNTGLTGLTPGTTYHFRVKAENALGIIYSNDRIFVTPGLIPSVDYLPITNLTSNSIVLNGTVNANLLSTTVLIEYGTTTGYGSSVAVIPATVTGNTTVNVTAALTGLSAGVTYHYRINATNELGTTFGSDMTFTVLTPVSDSEGNVYEVVKIGTQVWMAENLKSSNYRNGDPIGTTTPARLDISAESTPKYQWSYEGDEAKVAIYGRIYTWYAANDSRNVCPSGWHVPTDAEFRSLENNYGGEFLAGGKLKEAGLTHWESPNYAADNSSSFSGLPAGLHWNNYLRPEEIFQGIGQIGSFWSSTSSASTLAWSHGLIYTNASIYIMSSDKKVGYSVRCIKD